MSQLMLTNPISRLQDPFSHAPRCRHHRATLLMTIVASIEARPPGPTSVTLQRAIANDCCKRAFME
jgi:hypothetical protein